MALSAKLVMRQGQSLVMTPQLMQAIKLLQFSSIELASFIEEELERNPLLERADERGDGLAETEDARAADDLPARDWASDELETETGTLEAGLGTELENAFERDGASPQREPTIAADGHGLSTLSWTGASAPVGDEDPNLERYVAAQASLRDHLAAQLALAVADPVDRLIGASIIDAIDDAGYLADEVIEIAGRLGTPPSRVERVLAVVHGFEPTGVGARSLGECLALQLRERDRFDPAMAILVANLDLLARRDHAALRRLCGVDDADLADMIAELRTLEPKPGRAFGAAPVQTVVPDVYVRAAPDGAWHVELNGDALPRVLVDHAFHARVSPRATQDADKSFLANCMQTASWLTKSLEQRARTILKVSTEIVRQQDAFFANGVQHLRPLNLKTVADAIGMHESTVSRVTSNKYMASPRGLFELKYFFSASIGSAFGGEAHSAEAVRFRIKQIIDGESAADVLSDDAIVARLRAADIDIARRTVAKYRESLRIPSSVERRREKAAFAPNGR